MTGRGSWTQTALICSVLVEPLACSRTGLNEELAGHPSESGPTSAGSAGGGAVTCLALEMTGDPISVAAQGLRLEPQLESAPTGEAVVMQRRETPPPGPPWLTYARFDAWGSVWPQSLEEEAVGSDMVVFGFVAGHGPAGPSVVWNQGPAGNPFFAASFLDGLEGKVLAAGARRPLFVSGSEDGWLAALSDESTGSSRMSLTEINLDLAESSGSSWACASTPVVAAALAVPGGQLVAMSSGAPFGDCELPGPGAPAQRLQVGRFTVGLMATLGAELELLDPVSQLILVPRPSTGDTGGAWLAYRTKGNGPEGSAVLAVAAVDATGALADKPLSITPAADSVGPAAAVALGESLVVVSFNTPDLGPPRLLARVVDRDLSLRLSAMLLSEAGMVPSRIALLASPDGTQFLAAWESSLGAATEHRVRVARFRCVKGS